jgi:hypothetical protein
MDQGVKDAMLSAVASLRRGLPVSEEAQVTLCMNYQDLAQLPVGQRSFIVEALWSRNNDPVKCDWAMSRVTKRSSLLGMNPSQNQRIDYFEDPLAGLYVGIERFTPPPTRAFAYRVRVEMPLERKPLSKEVSGRVSTRYAIFDRARNPSADAVDRVAMVPDGPAKVYYSVSKHKYPLQFPRFWWGVDEAVAVGLELARVIGEEGIQ